MSSTTLLLKARPSWLRAPSDARAGTVVGDERVIRRLLVVLGLGTLMSSVDSTVTTIVLHTLGRDLGSPVLDVQWVVTGYLLATASVIPVSGWIARRLGARRVYTVALALFTLTSALCAVAGSLPELVAFRVLQGAAAGLLTPLSQLIAAEVAGPARMGRMMSRIWMVTDIGAVLGPLLGGVIIDALGWRWIFMINVPIGLLAMVASFRLLPSTPTRPAGRLDLSGLARVSLGFPLLVFALAQAERANNPTSPAALIPFLAAIVLLGDFVRHARRCAHPLLDLRLYTRRTFAAGALSVFSFDIAWFGALLLLPLYFQQVRGLPPATAGLILAPQGIGMVIGLWAAGRIADRARASRRGAAAVAAFAAINLVLAHIGPTSSYWIICPLLLIAGLAAGHAWVPATAAGYADLSPDEISHASPLMSVTMRLGASLGTAFAAVVLQSALSHNLNVDPTTHLISAYHASFEWISLVALIALVMFGALYRSTLGGEPTVPMVNRRGISGCTSPPGLIARAVHGRRDR